MNKNIPRPAAMLLDFIRETEVGTSARRGYDIIYSNKQHKLSKPITTMTILEVQQGQSKQWANHNNGRNLTKSSATGGYQFMYKTLGELIIQFNLDIHQKFTPDLQDWLGYMLLKRRKYDQWIKGEIGDIAFARRLAQEWASFPVLRRTKGAHRMVNRGQSYYAGDGLNKSLTSPETIEKILRKAKHAPTVVDTSPTEDEGEDMDDFSGKSDIPTVSNNNTWLFIVVVTILGFVFSMTGSDELVKLFQNLAEQ